MMNVMLVLLAKRVFFNIIEDINSKFLLSLLTCSKPPALCMNNAISFQLITFTISRTYLGGN